jgi:tetratricopeptide (TPR) repeat protein
MEWRLGKRSTDITVEAIRKELLRCDYQSLDIGRMLARLLRDLSKLSQVEILYKGLSSVHPLSALYEIESQIAFMRGEFGKALSLAKRWAREEPFDPAAAVDVTYLLAEVERRYEEAARFGEAALRRVPSSAMLVNNVAFGWAMAGNFERAMKLLTIAPDTPYTCATRGLVKLAQGDIAGGTEDYERAAALAKATGGEDLARFIRLRRVIALHELGYAQEDPQPLLADLDDSTDPVVLVLRRQVRQLT